ncbi:ADP-ribosyl-[dinitrogen reductase] hydrolase [Caldimonas tepidiphila]|uniref:ADP-ribosyl-[dinitrogen reductase] hydrolase n=1 Tax=Caldimonas tepidiphila TaxID=2315841 RepID=UPI000E5C3741|nr:ADP-ribosyl-[dinitrogen reductase] hydrolase [Caldimonas tepidiphila]
MAAGAQDGGGDAAWPGAIDPAIQDRALGAYLGLAIGDALGATVEFMTPREIAARHGVHRRLCGGGWLKLPAGAVTDDTTMALALGDALLAARGLEMRRVAEAFVAWLRAGPVDCGDTCRRGIRRYLADGSFSGPPNEGDGGNGALMRNLPVALATLHAPALLEPWSLAQARFTHHHPLSDAATVAFGRMAQALVLGEPFDRVRGLAAALVERHPRFRHTPWPGRASGYVADTVQTVLHHVLCIDDPVACLVAVVNRGDDADTTGALAGMLLGARAGVGAWPREWLDGLDAAVARGIRAQVRALLGLAAGLGAAAVR